MYIERSNFLPGLHVLRGLAAASTVLFHLHLMQPVFRVKYLHFVNTLGAGVTLFFMISCFSLFHSTLPKLDRNNWLAGFVLRRLFRIYPLFLFMLAVHLALHFIIYHKIYSPGEVLLNLLLMYQFYPGAHESIIWAGWTIGVEVTFYCLFPLLLATSRKFSFWLILFLVTMALSHEIPAMISSLNLNNSYAYMSFPRQLFVFIGGGVVYLLAGRYPDKTLFGLAALGASIVILYFTGTLTAKVLFIGCMIYAFHKSPLLFNPFTRFLGEASYTIYLVHPVVVAGLKPWLTRLYGLGLPDDLSFIISFVIVFSIVCVISLIINKFIEIPVYRFGVKIAERVESAPLH